MKKEIGQELHSQIQYRLIEELSAAEKRYRELVEHVREAIFKCDTRGKISFLNRAWTEILGYPVEESIGASLGDYICEEDRENGIAMITQQSSDENIEKNRELCFKKSDGNLVWLMLSTRIGAGEEIVGSLYNINERKRAEEELADANEQLGATNEELEAANEELNSLNSELEERVEERTKEKEHLWRQLLQSQKMESIGLLSGRISHDFNNMLTPIVGFSKILDDLLTDDSPEKEMAERIYNSSMKASKLIDQLLTFSKKQVFEKQSIEINDILNDMRKMLTSLIGEDIKLKLTTAARISTIFGDETQIQQIILNLAVNARQAMPNGGTLSIMIENVLIDDEYAKTHHDVEKGNYVVLSVEDTGAGMSQEVQMQIFDPFFTTRGDEKGSGLGLSTVYGVVKQHDGFMRVYSELEKGTKFMVYFPASAVETKEKTKEKAKEKAKEKIQLEGTETVLVVDDKPMIVDMISKLLTLNGYNVIHANTGEEAIKAHHSNDGDIDLLLTDIVMPRVDGWELYKEINGKSPAIKVIFMSGFVENSVVLNNIEEKGFPFIKKPLDPHELLRKIRKVLDGEISIPAIS